MEVFYRLDSGVLVRGFAHYSYRKGPVGEWMLGNVPLSDIKQVPRSEWTTLDHMADFVGQKFDRLIADDVWASATQSKLLDDDK